MSNAVQTKPTLPCSFNSMCLCRIRLTESDRQADAITHQFLKDTESLVNVKDDLGLTTATLISYLTSRAIAENKNSVYVGLPAPAKAGVRK